MEFYSPLVNVRFYKALLHNEYIPIADSKEDEGTLGFLLGDCHDGSFYLINNDSIPDGVLGGTNSCEFSIIGDICIITPLFGEKKVSLYMDDLRILLRKWIEFISTDRIHDINLAVSVISIESEG